MYKRVMLKLSGEALGKQGWLYDFDKIDQVAGVLCRIVDRGIELGVVIGGGNLWRGRQGGASDMNIETADQMGMLGTVMNCLCMKDAVRRAGGSAIVMSALDMPRVCETYRGELALRHMKEGAVVLFGGGLGNPCFTTDSAVALRAVEVQADALLLAKNVDGVYSDDPRVNPKAELLRNLTYAEALERNLRVMDLSAFSICQEQKVPALRVFGLDDPENILKVLDGDDMGTTLRP
ncbi:MAG: UMP kinase [Clostridiales bacterium]|nr:UMP kinase [Clostridiales bacterium]